MEPAGTRKPRRRIASLVWILTAWINIGTSIMMYAHANYGAGWTVAKALHAGWLLMGLAHWVRGMVAFSHFITGRTISELNRLWVDMDARPMRKCLMSLAAFAVLAAYCVSSPLGALPYLLLLSFFKGTP